MKIEDRKKEAPHVLPLEDDTAAGTAIQAVALGCASPDQQKMAMHYILYSICMLNRPAYFPGDDQRRNTDIMIGMQQAGHEINKRIKANFTVVTDRLKEKEASHGRNQSARNRTRND